MPEKQALGVGNVKNVVLSADGDRMVYSVPDIVAENLQEYCLSFCDHWLSTSPHAEKYRVGGGYCYNEADFIAYLNRWVFPEQPSKLVENLGWIAFDQELPDGYQGLPQFHF